jgi:thiol-disulfide isomerase/thioredoxin
VAAITLQDALGSEGLRDLDGRLWRAEALGGRRVLLDVWATWCAPCLEDLPALRQLARLREPALVVIGISLDTMPRRTFVSWLSRHGVFWPQHFDGRGYRGPVADRLGVTTLPASLLFDAHGRILARNLRAREVAAWAPP